MMIKPITICAITGLLVACSAQYVGQEKRNFDAACSRLNLSKTVSSQLYGFKQTESEGRAAHIKAVYEFLSLHQLWRGNMGRPAESGLLTVSDITTLLGPYDEADKDGNWIYHFKNNKSASLRLEFKDGYLAQTGYEIRK